MPGGIERIVGRPVGTEPVHDPRGELEAPQRPPPPRPLCRPLPLVDWITDGEERVRGRSSRGPAPATPGRWSRACAHLPPSCCLSSLSTRSSSAPGSDEPPGISGSPRRPRNARAAPSTSPARASTWPTFAKARGHLRPVARKGQQVHQIEHISQRLSDVSPTRRPNASHSMSARPVFHRFPMAPRSLHRPGHCLPGRLGFELGQRPPRTRRGPESCSKGWPHGETEPSACSAQRPGLLISPEHRQADGLEPDAVHLPEGSRFRVNSSTSARKCVLASSNRPA